jgi:hypothetical protein
VCGGGSHLEYTPVAWINRRNESSGFPDDPLDRFNQHAVDLGNVGNGHCLPTNEWRRVSFSAELSGAVAGCGIGTSTVPDESASAAGKAGGVPEERR